MNPTEVALPQAAGADYRSGTVAIVGRPNVGKSTLLNALLGERLSITSRRPQTTRHRILGVLTRPDWQIGLVDTPGYQTLHNEVMPRMMNRAVTQAVSGVDAVILVIEAGKFNDHDRRVLKLIPAEMPIVLAVNKVDLIADKARLYPFVQSVSDEQGFAGIVPLSAESGLNIEALLSEVAKRLPRSPPMFDADTLTDRSERFIAAERVREKLFRLTGDEIPFAATVEIEQWEETPRGKRIAAAILVSRESHKQIVIGAKGERIKRIGQEARQDLIQFFGCPVHLELWVKVRGGWADSEASLRALGYD
jgi:GTP-binding protein Era